MLENLIKTEPFSERDAFEQQLSVHNTTWAQVTVAAIDEETGELSAIGYLPWPVTKSIYFLFNVVEGVITFGRFTRRTLHDFDARVYHLIDEEISWAYEGSTQLWRFGAQMHSIERARIPFETYRTYTNWYRVDLPKQPAAPPNIGRHFSNPTNHYDGIQANNAPNGVGPTGRKHGRDSSLRRPKPAHPKRNRGLRNRRSTQLSLPDAGA